MTYENGEDLHYNGLSDVIIYDLRKWKKCLRIRIFLYLFDYFKIYLNHGYLKLWNLCLSLSLKDCWAAYGKYFRESLPDRDIHTYLLPKFKLCSLKSLRHERFFPADPITLRSSLVSSPGSADFDSLFLKWFHKNVLPFIKRKYLRVKRITHLAAVGSNRSLNSKLKPGNSLTGSTEPAILKGQCHEMDIFLKV